MLHSSLVCWGEGKGENIAILIYECDDYWQILLDVDSIYLFIFIIIFFLMDSVGE